MNGWIRWMDRMDRWAVGSPFLVHSKTRIIDWKVRALRRELFLFHKKMT